MERGHFKHAPHSLYGKHFCWRVNANHLPSFISVHLLYFPPSALPSFFQFRSNLFSDENRDPHERAVGFGSRLNDSGAGFCLWNLGQRHFQDRCPFLAPPTCTTAPCPLSAHSLLCLPRVPASVTQVSTWPFSALTFSLLRLASPLIAYLHILPVCSNSQRKESDHRRSLSFHGATGRMLTRL